MHVQTTGVRMADVAQNAEVEVTGVAVRGAGVANIVTKVSSSVTGYLNRISPVLHARYNPLFFLFMFNQL